MSSSIYQLINSALTDGKLPSDFSLPSEEIPDGIRWAPGAKDGVLIYHWGLPKLDESSKRTMARAVKAASDRKYQKAEEYFAELGLETPAVSLVDELQKQLIKHIRHLNDDAIHSAAVWMVVSSENIECVKIGLELLELYDEPDEELKEIIRRLGQFDEFTLYAIWNMRGWENGNDEIFRLARRVNGWGRIHAVEWLEPTTPEIRHWLLTEGTKNEVLYAYSALICWEKSGAKALLQQDITQDEFDGLAVLIEGLLDEGPVPGISKLEDPITVLQSFLNKADEQTLNRDNYEVIAKIQRWYENREFPDDILLVHCAQLLESEACREAIACAVKEGKSLDLAQELGIPFLEDLYECMSRDFGEHYFKCDILLSEKEYHTKTLNLFRTNLPLSEMRGLPRGVTASGPEHERYSQLECILCSPLVAPEEGTDFICTGLCSPYSRTRNLAVQCMKNWVGETKLSLAALSPELYKAATKAVCVETDDNLSSLLSRLINGETAFKEETESEVTEDE